MQERQDVRAFGANLVLVVAGLFFGALFFTYIFRRNVADEWKAAWDFIALAAERLGGALGCLLLAALIYRKPFVWVSTLLGLGAAALLLSFAPDAGILILDGGSRAPAIALYACCVLFAFQAIVLSLWGQVVGGDPVFRRVLLFQFALALLILPVVFKW